MDLKDIGKFIREKRISKKWKQEDLAEHTNLSVQYIGMIERGEKLPRLETFIRIANVLEASADELLAGVIINGNAGRISQYYEKMSCLSSSNQKLLYKITEIFFTETKER